MNAAIKDYLGDSVYASFDGYAVTLYLDNGFGPKNEIVMEPQVLDALNRFKIRCQKPQTEVAAALIEISPAAAMGEFKENE